MKDTTRTGIYIAGLAVVLGTLFAFFLWYSYLQKQKTSQTFDSVFSAYAPGSGGGGGQTNGAGSVRANQPAQSAQAPKTPTEFTNSKKPISSRISDAPVGAGSDVVGDSVRFVDRGKGYVFQTNLSSGKTERISNVVLPGAFDVRFLSSTNAVVQTLDPDGTIVAHALTFTKDGNATEVPIPLSILDMVTNDEAGLVYALARSDEGGVALVSFPIPYDTAQKPTIVWTSSLTNWQLERGGADSLYLAQKAANGIPGTSYLFSLKTKALSKITGDTPGLSGSASPTASYVLETTGDGATVTTRVRSLTTKTSVTLPRITFPEKCVWETDGSGSTTGLLCGFPKAIPLYELPDVWYRGAFIFDDVLGRVDLATGEVVEVETKLEDAVDMVDLRLGGGGNTLIFTDKKTSALWTVKNIK
jgi:hypothetical protein